MAATLRWLTTALGLGLTPSVIGCSASDDVALGQGYVKDRQCASCHQSASPADGVLSGLAAGLPGTQVYPANLTPDIATGLGRWADIQIVRAMRYGVDDEQEPLCPPMPRFSEKTKYGDPMFDAEAYAIVAYLRSLKAVSRPDLPDSVCPPLKPFVADMGAGTDDAGASIDGGDAGTPVDGAGSD
jgi:hypothetical protein